MKLSIKAGLLVLITLIILSCTVFADSAIKVTLDGKPVTFDVQPYIDAGKNRTMVPMRKIFESLGASVYWDQESQTVTAKKSDGNNIKITIGADSAEVKGVAVPLDCPAVVKDGRTMVPLRFVSENLGANVKWDDKTQTVVILTIKKLFLTDTMEKAAENAGVAIQCDYGNYYTYGSGVIISSDGIIVTNYHVIDKSQSIIVKTRDKKQYSVQKVIGYDKDIDMAVIKIDINYPNYATIASDDSVNVGDEIYAMGNAEGAINKLAIGTIYDNNWQYSGYTMIECLLKVEHGDSGGGVYNYKGELIGIMRLSGIIGADGQEVSAYVPIRYLADIEAQNKNLSVREFAAESSKTVEISDLISELQDKYDGKNVDGGYEHVFVDNIFKGAQDNNDSEQLTIYIAINYDHYKEFEKGLTGNDKDKTKEATENLMKDIYTRAKELFSDKTICVYYYLYDSFTTIPDEFQDSEYKWYDSTSKEWTIELPIYVEGYQNIGGDYTSAWLIKEAE